MNYEQVSGTYMLLQFDNHNRDSKGILNRSVGAHLGPNYVIFLSIKLC